MDVRVDEMLDVKAMLRKLWCDRRCVATWFVHLKKYIAKYVASVIRLLFSHSFILCDGCSRTP